MAKDRENTCYHQTKHLPTVEDDGLDAIELLFLRLFRYVCATIASRTTQGWEAAYHVAREALGRVSGYAPLAQPSCLPLSVSTARPSVAISCVALARLVASKTATMSQAGVCAIGRKAVMANRPATSS